MKVDTDDIVAWLKDKVQPLNGSISRAAIFGSLVRNSVDPGDCDLLLVGISDPETEPWEYTRQYVREMSGQFLRIFRIPLSVVLLTYGEWEELENFFWPRLPIMDR
jgi:RPA family protein